MGQVPKILTIGSGKLAKHWNHYLSILGIETCIWSRKSNLDLTELSQQADIIFLAISDDHIASFYQENLSETKAICIHFSGSLAHEKILGLHPLQTFQDSLYKEDTYKEIPLILDFPETIFKEILPFLPNSTYSIAKDKKTMYHALCVISGNFPQMLWGQVEKELHKIGLDKTILKPFLEKAVSNFILSDNYLTGPFVRKDNNTIKKHQEALSTSSLKNIYNQFLSFYTNEVKNEYQ